MSSPAPRMIARSARLVELTLPNKASAASYALQAHKTLDGAFAGATAMFSVRKGGMFRSSGLRRKGLGMTGASYRNLTRIVYDPDEYFPDAPTTLPPDAHQAYLRVVETNLAGTVLPASPILVLPPPGTFTSPRPSLTLRGTAPAAVALSSLVPPPGAMHIILPRFSDNITLRNLDGANSLFISFHPGQPEYEIPFGQVESFWDNVMSDIYVRGDGGAVAFSLLAAIVNGEMA